MAQTEKFWDMSAGTYDRSEGRFEPLHAMAIENTRKYLQASDIVLDYGCATGTKALELAGYVKRIQGIDISSKMIAAAKTKALEREIHNADFAQATIFDDSYQTESFDLVLAFNILHLLEDNRQAVHRITELLKPGGLFVSTTPCLKEKMALFNRLELYGFLTFFFLVGKLNLIPVPSYLGRFRFSELEALLAGGAFQIVETEELYHRFSSYFIAARKI